MELHNAVRGRTVQPAYINLFHVILDVTHVRIEPRPFPAYRTASDEKLGRGLGTRLPITRKRY